MRGLKLKLTLFYVIIYSDLSCGLFYPSNHTRLYVAQTLREHRNTFRRRIVRVCETTRVPVYV